jgi:hypothetical protein
MLLKYLTSIIPLLTHEKSVVSVFFFGLLSPKKKALLSCFFFHISFLYSRRLKYHKSEHLAQRYLMGFKQASFTHYVSQ